MLARRARCASSWRLRWASSSAWRRVRALAMTSAISRSWDRSDADTGRSPVVATASAPRTEWPATNGRITRSRKPERLERAPILGRGGRDRSGPAPLDRFPAHAHASSRREIAGGTSRHSSARRPALPDALGDEIAGTVVQLQERDAFGAAKLRRPG